MADISVSLTLDDSQYQRALAAATKSMDLFAKNASSNNTKVQNSVNQISKDIDNLNKSVSGITSVFKAMFAAISVREVTKLSDEVANLRNRLSTLSSSQQDVENQFKALSAIAITTRSSLSDIGDLYYRIASNATALGISQRDAAQITENVAKSLASAGISAQSASGALLQLGQVFSSGVVQGEELNSILESMGPVAQALAKYLDVPIGSLKRLASEGKISALDMKNALLSATGDIDKAFGKTKSTISQAMNVLNTSLAMSWDNFEKNTKTGESLAQTIEYLGFTFYKLSKSIDSIIGPLSTAVELFASVWIGGKIIKGVQAVGAAIGATGTAIRSMGGATAEGVSNWKIFGQQFESFKRLAAETGVNMNFLRTMAQHLISPFKELGVVMAKGGAYLASFLGLDYVIDKFKETGEEAKKAGSEYQEYLKEMQSYKDALSTQAGAPKFDTTAIDQQIRSTQTLFKEKLKQYQLDNDIIGKGENYARVQKAIAEIESERAKEIEKLNKQYGDGAKRNQDINNLLQSSISKVNNEYDQQVKTITDVVAKQNDLLAQERQSLFNTEQRIESTKRIRDLEHERATMFLPLIEQKYRDIEKAADDSIVAQIEAEAKARGLKSPSELPLSDVDKITDSVRRQIEYEKDMAAAVYDTNNQLQLKSFRLQTINDTNAELKDIYDDMASSTLREIDRLEFNIMKSAQDRAIAEIQAEEARRGSRLSAEEAQEYYDTSIQGTKELIEATKKSYDMSRSWATGWTIAMNDYIDTAANAAQHAQNIFASAMKGMEDLLINFVKTGKFQWKNFMAMLLEELLRAQIQSIFANMISDMSNSMKKSTSIFGGGGSKSGSDSGSWLSGIGSWFSGISSMFGGSGSGSSSGGLWDSLSSIGKSVGNWFGGFFANGGQLASGKWGIVGENGPEIISGPANIKPLEQINSSSGGGNVTNINYTINAIDSQSFKQALAKDPSFIYGLTLQGAKGVPIRR